MFVRIMSYVLAAIAVHLEYAYMLSSITHVIYIFGVSTQNVTSYFCSIKSQKSGIGLIVGIHLIIKQVFSALPL